MYSYLRDTTLAYYQNTNRVPRTRPSAFVGWTETIYYSTPKGTRFGEWGDYQQYADYRSQWMFLWAFNAQFSLLREALEEARRTSGWITAQTQDRVLRVFGYNNLRFDDYNRREDWGTQ